MVQDPIKTDMSSITFDPKGKVLIGNCQNSFEGIYDTTSCKFAGNLDELRFWNTVKVLCVENQL